ncbi:DUF1931 family protein [Thermopetrobacter sp. TC1]|uniref:DUF1931 family protein n=1 Tax=Thermopetrobacter sp. TC1 TaxID=1495045 RepID=UPI00057119B8|nr:DUF1931 family protein [Thermopetrobacter sp. TC1]
MVMGVRQFEKLFRLAAGLDIDKSDIKRLDDFVNERLHDLLLMAQRMAKMNGRDVITEADVPLTKGLQESMQQFKEMDEELSASDILAHLAKLPALDLAIGEDVEAMLPELAGGITVSLAKVFKVLDPEMKNPQTEHWERVEQIYAILV